MVGISCVKVQDFPQLEYDRYMHRFRAGLIHAIEENTVDETHLLGVYFIIGSSHALQHSPQSVEAHVDGFCTIMDHLNQQAKDSRRKFPLQHVWRLLLSYIRRGYQYPYPSAHTSSLEKTDAQLLAMHDLDMQLPSNYTLRGEINCFVGSSYYTGEERCRRLSRGWDVWDILSSLKAKFRGSYYRHAGATALETHLLFGSFIESIRAGTGGFERFQYLHEEFEVSITGQALR